MSFNTFKLIEEAKKQVEYERTFSLGGFREVVRNTIADWDYDSLTAKWLEYCELVKNSEIEHSDYHYRLMTQTSMKWSKVFEVTIENLVFTYSYLEHRLLGYKLGQKLANKTYGLADGRKKTSVVTKLTLGSNIVEFLKWSGYLRNKVIKGADKHTHNIVEATSKLQEFISESGLYQRASKVRSGSCGYKFLPHASDSAGGMYSQSKTMLNSSGFNSNSTQNELVCEVLNKLQSVKFNLINEDKLYGLLEEYKEDGRWYDANGIFMVNEWNKLIEDVSRFKNEEFSFSWAMDDRGRMYDGGTYISVQGDSYQKAMLELGGKKIVKMDAKNQSLGIYALLGADDVSAPRLGLSAKTFIDLRIALASSLNRYVGKEEVFTKDTVKHLVMIFFYGGMEKQLMDNIDTIKDDVRYAGKYTIRDLFPEDKKEGAYKIVVDTLTELAPGAVKLMNLIYAFNDADKTKYSWVMPDGFKVETTATTTVVHKGFYVDLEHKVTRSVSIEAKVEYNTRFNRSLAPNVIHSIDAYIAREVIRRCDFDIMVIHDSFGVTEENVTELVRVYKEVLADVLEMDLLSDILKQIDGTKRFKILKGGLTRADIMAGSPLSAE